MTLRITDAEFDEHRTVRVEGRLEGDGVAELDDLCRASSAPLRLELDALLNVDEVGLGLLRALIASGAIVTGASPYIRYLLGGSTANAAREV